MASDNPKSGESRAQMRKRNAKVKAGVARVRAWRQREAAAGGLGKYAQRVEMKRRARATSTKNRTRRKA